MSGLIRLLCLKEKLLVAMVSKFLAEIFTDLDSYLIFSACCRSTSPPSGSIFVQWYATITYPYRNRMLLFPLLHQSGTLVDPLVHSKFSCII